MSRRNEEDRCEKIPEDDEDEEEDEDEELPVK